MVDPGKDRIVLSTPGASGAGISVRERSLPVSGSATAMLSSLKARDQVVVACADNAAMESFFALLQRNVLDRQRWTTREELRLAIVIWIERTYHRRWR